MPATSERQAGRQGRDRAVSFRPFSFWRRPASHVPKALVHGPGGAASMRPGYRLYPNPLMAAGGTYRNGSSPRACQAWCAANATCEGAVLVDATRRCYSLPKARPAHNPRLGSCKRALLTARVTFGSHYRCARSTFKSSLLPTTGGRGG